MGTGRKHNSHGPARIESMNREVFVSHSLGSESEARVTARGRPLEWRRVCYRTDLRRCKGPLGDANDAHDVSGERLPYRYKRRVYCPWSHERQEYKRVGFRQPSVS
jgi:hypothetical protein